MAPGFSATMAVISAPALYAPRGPTLSEKTSIPLGAKDVWCVTGAGMADGWIGQ